MLIERCFDAILADGLAFHQPGVPSGWRSIRLAFHQAQPAASRRRQRQSSRPPRRIDHNLLLRLGVRK